MNKTAGAKDMAPIGMTCQEALEKLPRQDTLQTGD
jgi:hypothetical protein